MRTKKKEQGNNAYRNIEEGSKSNLVYKHQSEEYSVTFRTLQTLCKNL